MVDNFEEKRAVTKATVAKILAGILRDSIEIDYLEDTEEGAGDDRPFYLLKSTGRKILRIIYREVK